jgi:hypothetical protein
VAVVLSHDTSRCWCSAVALPPSDAMLAFLCVSTPASRAAVRLPVLLYVSAFRRRRVVLLHVRPSRRHSLFAVAVLLLCAERLFSRA